MFEECPFYKCTDDFFSLSVVMRSEETGDGEWGEARITRRSSRAVPAPVLDLDLTDSSSVRDYTNKLDEILLN